MSSFHRNIHAIEEKLHDPDADVRFMGLNDLSKFFSESSEILTSSEANRVFKDILPALDDVHADVQNEVVIVLSALAKLISIKDYNNLINKLLSKLSSIPITGSIITVNTSMELSIITSAIRAVVNNAPVTDNLSSLAFADVIHTILPLLTKSLDFADILTDITARYGSSFSPDTTSAILRTVLDEGINARNGAIRRSSENLFFALFVHLDQHTASSTIDLLASNLANVELSRPESVSANSTVLNIFLKLIKAKTLLNATSVKNLVMKTISIPTFSAYSSAHSDLLLDSALFTESALLLVESALAYYPESCSENATQIIDAALFYVKFNPNNLGDFDQNVDMDDFAGSEVDDDDALFEIEDEDDYDDDSWRLRKSAAQLLATLLITYQDSLLSYFSNSVMSLLQLCNDTSELVVAQGFSSLASLVNSLMSKKTSLQEGRLTSDGLALPSKRRRSEDISLSAHDNAASTLCNLLNQNVATLTSLIVLAILPASANVSAHYRLSSQPIVSLSPRWTAFQLVLSLTSSNFDVLSIWQQVSPGIEIFATDSSYAHVVQNILADIIEYINDDKLRPYFESLASMMINSLSASPQSHRVSVLSKLYAIGFSTYIDSSQALWDYLYRVFISKETDLEIRTEAGLSLIECCKVNPAPDSVIRVIEESISRLDDENTRITGLKMILELSKYKDVIACAQAQLILRIFESCIELLRQSNKVIRSTSSFILLNLSGLSIDSYIASSETIDCYLNKMALMLKDEDVSILEAGFGVFANFSHRLESSLLESLMNDLPEYVANQVIENSEDATVNLCRLISNISSVSKNLEICRRAYQTLLSANTTSTALAAKIASIFITEAHLNEEYKGLIRGTIENLQSNPQVASYYLSIIHCVGPVGPMESTEWLYKLIESSDLLEIRRAAAKALGAFICDKEYEIKSLLTKMSTEYALSGDLVTAVTEMVLNPAYVPFQDVFNEDIYEALFGLAYDGVSPASVLDVKTKVANCIATIGSSDPDKWLVILKENLSSESSERRGISIAAIAKIVSTLELSEYGYLIKDVISETLNLIEDQDIDNRQLALSALKVSIFCKFDLVEDNLSNIVTLALANCQPDESLIQIVQMGPFKHKVDNGFAVRRLSYEILLSLCNDYDQSLNSFSKEKILSACTRGLQDDQDIAVLSLRIIESIFNSNPVSFWESQFCDSIISGMQSLRDKKLKENSPRQEIELAEQFKTSLRRTAHGMAEKLKDLLIPDSIQTRVQLLEQF
ncbi:hypothetical protein CANCADRAFT_3756 [Tortispora caseinolytica NRRL Y-17796]|uniref:TATA-binding protein interacting (TIP20) domain-containing protein n=1 Tax=Tortispora caseinolytica NRRL Y-17796 TaxID=767744 RepID=A0A1E4TBK5_9ASCO|nr:hypothetical protein CANCADRAFT_3756 [Tortispora caseinolytica NRRL Y-17796]